MEEKKEMPLADIQKWMQDLLLNPYQEHTKDGIHLNTIDSLVKSSKRLSAVDHLAIYQRSYVARLRDCMTKQFSALEYALGEDLFRAFADEYLQRYPSTSYNLINLGEKFPQFLNETRPDIHQETREDWPDFMIELAQFEYDINIIFEEKADEDYLLASESTPEDLLQLIPALHVFHFQHPIRSYYTAFANDQTPDLPLPVHTFCAVRRHQYKLTLHDLNHGQYLFLQYLQAGDTLVQAKEKFLVNNPIAPEQFDSFWPVWKKHWVQEGFFMSC